MINVLENFLKTEIDRQEMYNEFILLITSYEIRNGECEGTEYIVKKMDRETFFIYAEHKLQDGMCSYGEVLTIDKKRLVDAIQSYAGEKGLKLADITI